MLLEPGKLLDRMLDDCMPDKSQWLDQFALSLNELQVKASTAFWRFSASQKATEDFHRAARLVHSCRGLRCAVNVATLDDLGRKHSMVCIVWGDDVTIVCHNSWGSDSDPIVADTPEMFVKAYLFDAHMTSKKVPLGKYIVSAPVPEEQQMWDDAVRAAQF